MNIEEKVFLKLPPLRSIQNNDIFGYQSGNEDFKNIFTDYPCCIINAFKSNFECGATMKIDIWKTNDKLQFTKKTSH